MANNTRSLLVNVLKKMCREGMNLGITEDAVDRMSFQALWDFFKANVNVSLPELEPSKGNARQLSEKDGLPKLQQMNWNNMDQVKDIIDGAVFSLKNSPDDRVVALDSELNFRVYINYLTAKTMLDDIEEKIANAQNRVEILNDQYLSLRDRINARPTPKKPGFFSRLFNLRSNREYKQYMEEVRQSDLMERELNTNLNKLNRYIEDKHTLYAGNPDENALSGDNPEPAIVQEAPKKEESIKDVVKEDIKEDAVNIIDNEAPKEEEPKKEEPEVNEPKNEEPEVDVIDNKEEPKVEDIKEDAVVKEVNEAPKEEEPKKEDPEVKEQKKEEPKVDVIDNKEEPKVEDIKEDAVVKEVNEAPKEEEPKNEEPKEDAVDNKEEPKIEDVKVDAVIKEVNEAPKEEEPKKEEPEVKEQKKEDPKVDAVDKKESSKVEEAEVNKEDINEENKVHVPIKNLNEANPTGVNIFEKFGVKSPLDNPADNLSKEEGLNIKVSDIKPSAEEKNKEILEDAEKAPESKQPENAEKAPEAEQPIEEEIDSDAISDYIVTAIADKIKEVSKLNETVYLHNNVLTQYLEDVKNVGLDIADFAADKIKALNSEELLNFAATAMLSEQLRAEHRSLNHGNEKPGTINTIVGPIERFTEVNGRVNVDATNNALKAYKTLPAVRDLAEAMQNDPTVFLQIIQEPENVLNPVFDNVKKQYNKYLEDEATKERQRAADEAALQRSIKQNRAEHYGVYVYHDENENKTIYLNENNVDIGYKGYKKLAEKIEAKKEQVIRDREAMKAKAEIDELAEKFLERRYEKELEYANKMQEEGNQNDYDEEAQPLDPDELVDYVRQIATDKSNEIVEANEKLYNNNILLDRLATNILQVGLNVCGYLSGEENNLDNECFLNFAASAILSEQLDDKAKPIDANHTMNLLNIYKKLPVIQDLADRMQDEVEIFVELVEKPGDVLHEILPYLKSDLKQYSDDTMNKNANEKSVENKIEIEKEKEFAPLNDDKSGPNMGF